ncbi:sulfocyanin-like copper-binding protein [Alicyclobacillus sp. SO9]|uniref:sulfocyanin-like copper-binding protein n=1 Tax=Alicyclobacillus sp. SO9 TaxID=2665646 RepID=UPI0018E76664|nr:sulfocyanin-like copper-binding protein [Alicyclobacillus sp. SO9]QQE80101.1 hypothetical protein GI364_06475 [Alicyclobacillus sp. SO9]
MFNKSNSGHSTLKIPQWSHISITVTLLSLALTGCASHNSTSKTGTKTSQSSPSSHSTGSPASKWMTVDSSTHTVTLKMNGAMNGRLNFNGYANGFMTITVPVNWHVHVQFVNKGQLHNSAMIAPIAAVKKKTPPKPAFSGAAIKNASKGIPSGASASFSFIANKPGKYAIMSGVTGYGTSGMWDHFNVSSVKSPSLTVKNG